MAVGTLYYVGLVAVLVVLIVVIIILRKKGQV